MLPVTRERGGGGGGGARGNRELRFAKETAMKLLQLDNYPLRTHFRMGGSQAGIICRPKAGSKRAEISYRIKSILLFLITCIFYFPL